MPAEGMAEDQSASGGKFVKNVELMFNTINHVLMGYVTIYLSYISYMNGFGNLFSWHIFLSSVGYTFFMTESFMVMYGDNSWSSSYKVTTKRTLHWVLQAIGGIAIFIGIALEYYVKEDRNRSHFKSDHAITGLVSLILILISSLNGVITWFAAKIRHIIKPVYIKLFHYITGIGAFVIGMASLMLEYSPRRMQSTENKNMLLSFTIIVILLTCIGTMKNMYGHLKTMCR
ncbi:transmembrane reductase CYB561D2-like [Uranotaenia lowii]|uniref:transmembrane reductase CYB561D2-like n=1 Tax=Uranotaenia lowii TaxID=190385 RepID=UPI0024792549|nr:transmembrane reductase CYB561D2-like [Uranotaenia lowii]